MLTHICHFSRPLHWLAAGILLAVLTIPASAQSFQCNNSTGVAPTVRAEGTAEFIGDIVFDCTGGIPTPHGQSISPVNIAVNLDTYMSSKVTATASNSVQFLEALLFVDEPDSEVNPAVPILNCGNAGAPDDTPQQGPGVCPMMGGGADGAAATYNGTAGHPNVFQGRSVGPLTGQMNQVLFIGVPIDPPGTVCPNQATQPVCHRILRITNIRGDAAFFGVTGNNVAMVHAQILVNPVSGLPIDSPMSVVARAQTGLSFTGGASSVRLQEGFFDSWKTRNIKVSLDNGSVGFYSYANLTNYPVDAAQNVLAFAYETESGFQWQNNGLNRPPLNNPPFGGFGFLNPNYPLFSFGYGGLNTGITSAGVANAGTRVAIRFNIPSGATVQVPQVVQLHNVVTNLITGVMVRTTANSAGAGPFSPASGALNSSNNLAVYEVLFANPNALEFADVPFALNGAPSNTNLWVTSRLAPFYTDNPSQVASSTLPVPRFGLPVITAGIDIDPGALPNTINLKPGGTVSVAILSTPAFDARTVNPLTVTLAGAPVKLKGQGNPTFSFQDVNGDGLLDIVIRVDTALLQLNYTDTQASLVGQTFEGQAIRGVDSVKIVH